MPFQFMVDASFQHLATTTKATAQASKQASKQASRALP
jgi:hypothetical protein